MYAKKSYVPTEAELHAFFNSTLDRVECLASCPGCLTTGKEPQYHTDGMIGWAKMHNTKLTYVF